MCKTDYLVYYYYEDGREGYEFVPSLGRALLAAFEFPPNDAVKSKIISPEGLERTYLLKGV